MLGISQQTHDLVFAIGSVILLIGLLPQIWHRTVLPISSCILITPVLLVFSLNYLTMEYWFATVVEAANVAAWFVLLERAVRFKGLNKVPTN